MDEAHQVSNGFVRRAIRTAVEKPENSSPLNRMMRSASFTPAAVTVISEWKSANADKPNVNEMMELAICVRRVSR